MSGLLTKLIVLAGFTVAFAAGLVTGYQQSPTQPTAQRSTAAGPATNPMARGPSTRGGMRPPPPASILARELNLDSSQRTQLEAIWREVALKGSREMEQQRREIRQKREDAVAALLEAEAAEQYRQILMTYEEEMNSLNNQWWDAYRNGVDKTKAILNPTQVERFDQILRRNTWGPDRGPGRGGRGGRGPGGGRGGAENRGDRPDRGNSREDRPREND
jgi:hypothetical protein